MTWEVLDLLDLRCNYNRIALPDLLSPKLLVVKIATVFIAIAM